MSTLLVLGASEGQLPAYREARRLGLRTIGVDQDAGGVAVPEADEFIRVSTRDVAAIRRAVGRRPIAGVVSPASDASALAVQSLCRSYRTPFCPSRAAALASLDKAVFRRVVDRLGLPRYGWVTGNDASDICTAARSLRFPVVVKPSQSSGSKGISVIWGHDELEESLRVAMKFGLDGRAIVEEFIDGVHFSAECLVRNQRPVFTAAIQRTVTPLPRLITLEQLVPAGLDDDTMRALERALSSVCRATGLERGPLNVDFVIPPSGEIHLVEMAARQGGNGISRLIQHAYGVNLTQAAVRVAVGRPAPVRPQRRKAVLLRILHAPADGIVEAVRGAAEVRAMPETVELEMFVKEGSPVHPYDEAAHKIGYVAVAGDTEPAARAALERALTVLKVDIAQGGSDD